MGCILYVEATGEIVSLTVYDPEMVLTDPDDPDSPMVKVCTYDPRVETCAGLAVAENMDTDNIDATMSRIVVVDGVATAVPATTEEVAEARANRTPEQAKALMI